MKIPKEINMIYLKRKYVHLFFVSSFSLSSFSLLFLSLLFLSPFSLLSLLALLSLLSKDAKKKGGRIDFLPLTAQALGKRLWRRESPFAAPRDHFNSPLAAQKSGEQRKTFRSKNFFWSCPKGRKKREVIFRSSKSSLLAICCPNVWETQKIFSEPKLPSHEKTMWGSQKFLTKSNHATKQNKGYLAPRN